MGLVLHATIQFLPMKPRSGFLLWHDYFGYSEVWKYLIARKHFTGILQVIETTEWGGNQFGKATPPLKQRQVLERHDAHPPPGAGFRSRPSRAAFTLSRASGAARDGWRPGASGCRFLVSPELVVFKIFSGLTGFSSGIFPNGRLGAQTRATSEVSRGVSHARRSSPEGHPDQDQTALRSWPHKTPWRLQKA